MDKKHRIFNMGYKKELFFSGIIAVLLCMLLSNYVSDLIYSMVKYEHIKVKIDASTADQSGPVAVIDNFYTRENSKNVISEKKYGFYNFEQLKGAVSKSLKVDLVEQSSSKYKYGYFNLYDKDSYLELSLPVYPNTCLTFAREINSFNIIVENESGSIDRRIANYDDLKTNFGGLVLDYSVNVENPNLTLNETNIYLFDTHDCLYIYMEYILIYSLIIIVCSVLLYSGFVIIKNGKFVFGSLSKTKKRIIFVTILIFHFLYTLINHYLFSSSINVLTEVTDAYYYLHPNAFDEFGNFSVNILKNFLFTFRGYIPVFTSVIFNTIDDLSNLNLIMPLYFLLFAAIISYTISYAMPKLFEALFEFKTLWIMPFMAYGFLFIFWRNYFYYPLTDLPAVSLCICSLAFFAYSLKNNSKQLFLSGIFIGLSTSYRASYSYVFYLLFSVLLIQLFTSFKKSRKINSKEIHNLIYFFLGVVLITLPQTYLNLSRGHIGLFPYSSSWAFDIASNCKISDTLYSFRNGLHSYGFLYPENKDLQLASIDQYLYMDKFYTFGELLHILLANPFEFLMGYLKKMFWAMSAGVEYVYGGKSCSSLCMNVTILLNYFLIGNLIYAHIFSSFKEEGYMKKNAKVLILIGMFTIILQNLLHIERRYYLIYYLLIYFSNAFLLTHVLKEKKGEVSKYYMIFITLFLVVSYTVRKTMEMNFM